MSKTILLFAAAAIFTLLSYGNSDNSLDNKKSEQSVPLIKSMEKIYDGESIGTITFKYDDQNRLINQKDEYDEYFVTYKDNEIKVAHENTTTTYKYSNGKLTTGCIDMGQEGKINIKYTYEGEKLSWLTSDFGPNGDPRYTDMNIIYKWKDGCMTEYTIVYNTTDIEEPQSTTEYEYTDIKNPFTIDVFTIDYSGPAISSLGKDLTSEYLPSKSHFSGIIDGWETEQNTTYEYKIDDATGRITEITMTTESETDYDGEIEKETNTCIFKLNY